MTPIDDKSSWSWFIRRSQISRDLKSLEKTLNKISKDGFFHLREDPTDRDVIYIEKHKEQPNEF